MFEIAGRGAKIRTASKPALQVIGLFDPLVRETAEMAYEFEQPYVMDGAKFTRAFGGAPTPLPDAIRATVAWYQHRRGLPQRKLEPGLREQEYGGMPRAVIR